MHYKIIIYSNNEAYQFVLGRKHTCHISRIVCCLLSPKYARDEIKEKLGLKMVISFSPKHVVPNPCEIIGLYLLINIKHKGTIGFLFNGLTRAREKIEP